MSRLSGAGMRAGLFFALLALAGSMLASCGEADGRAVVKVAWVLPAGHPSSKALAFFERRVEELGGGAIDVRLFPSGVLGSATELIEGVREGNIEIACVSAAPLAQFAPDLNVLSMPCLFRDPAHQHATVDGEIGARLGAKLAERGLHCLGYFDAGSRNLMTKKGPIRSPGDLRGIKIRVMSSRLMVDALGAMGAAAQPMGQGEVYSALQTGVLDGWENNPQTALSFRMYETGCTHFAWTRHLAVPDVVVAGRGFLESLDPSTRAVLEQAMKETVARQRELWRDGERAAIEALMSKGMQFNEVERAAFAERVEPLYLEYAEKYGEDFAAFCREIRASR